MKTDQELERLLRDTLTNRAGVVQRPAAVPDLRRRRPWLPALAAAAVVALIAAGVVIGNHVSRNAQPAHPSPKPTKTTTTVVPTACSATLPAAWRTALANGAVPLGGAGEYPMSVAADGTIVVYRDDGVHPGDSRDVVLVRAGRAPRIVYRVPDPDQLDVQSAYLDGNDLVVATGSHPRPARGVIPGDSPMPNVRSLVVIDLTSGSQHVLASTTAADEQSGGRSIQSAALYDHTVYWDERASYTASTGVLHAYSLRTGRTTTPYRGPLGYLYYGATGVSTLIGSDSFHLVLTSPALPAGLDNVPNLTSAATDGTAWAWFVNGRTIGYWSPGRSPTQVVLPKPVTDIEIAQPGNLTVSGGYVFVDDRELLDVRDRVVVPLGGKRLWAGHADGGILSTYGSTAAGYAMVGTGHWVDGYWADPAQELLRIDTRTLPALRC